MSVSVLNKQYLYNKLSKKDEIEKAKSSMYVNYVDLLEKAV